MEGECVCEARRRQHLIAAVAHGVAVPEREGELQGVPVRAPRAAPGGRGGHRASQVVGGGGGGGGRGGGGLALVIKSSTVVRSYEERAVLIARVTRHAPF
jgi:hypothetical protein